MTIRRVYKSLLPSVNYFTKKGMQLPFMLGRLETDNPDYIEELDAEVKNGHPHIYIDQAEKEIDTEAPTPMELIRQQAYNQARADLIASGQMSDKVSTSDSGDFKNSVTNTVTIAEGAMQSDGASAGDAAAAAGAASVAGAKLMSAAIANLKK